MEKITITQEDNLQNYLDGKLEGPALEQLKNELASTPALVERLEELRRVHKYFQGSTLESPSSSFVGRVMSRLQNSPTYSYPSPKNGIILVLGVIIAAGMLVGMVSAGLFDQVNGLISIEEVAPVKKYFQQSLPTISINGKLLIRILVGLNLVIAFIVLDRTVLRPFFQRRAL